MTAILQYLENLAFIKNDTVYDIWYITNNLQNKLKSFFNYDTGGQFIFYPQLFKIDYKDIKITTPDINFLIVFNNQNNTKKIPHLYYNALEKFVEKNYHHSQILIYSHTIHLKISEYKIGLIPISKEENNTNNEIYKALIDCKYLAKNINKINKLLINQNMSHNNTIYSLITIIKECNKKYKLLHPSKLEQEIVRYNFIQNNNMNLEDYFYDFMYNLCKNNSYLKKILQNIEYYKEIHSNNMLINELKKLFD